jgi:OOP family OmpA-OmpF porin
MFPKTVLALAIALATISPALPQETDAEGCKDSPLLSRMKSCYIRECSKKDFDEAEAIAGTTADGPTMKRLEGEVEIITYGCAKNVSLLNIARNVENGLKQAGFSVVFSGRDSYENPAVTARKGGVWASLVTQLGGDEPQYVQTVVKTKEMEQQIVANGDVWEDEINKTGRCSIYGVQFDSGRASIKADSTATLGEMARLLKKNSAWTMRIEGHTDNIGGKEANVKLSEQRAAAVRAWLVAHGIPESRLVARGFGDSKPVADNTSDEGRAKNRRVDLVKM